MFTAFVETIALRDQYAGSIRTALNSSCIHRHGRFKIAVSDQAKNVDGSVVTKLFPRKETFFFRTTRG